MYFTGDVRRTHKNRIFHRQIYICTAIILSVDSVQFTSAFYSLGLDANKNEDFKRIYD